MNLRYDKHDFGLDAEWIFFALCVMIRGAVKRHTAKRSLQRPLNDKILD